MNGPNLMRVQLALMSKELQRIVKGVSRAVLGCGQIMQNDERETPLFEAFGMFVFILICQRRLEKAGDNLRQFWKSREAKEVEEERGREPIASSPSRRRRRRAGSNGDSRRDERENSGCLCRQKDKQKTHTLVGKTNKIFHSHGH